jgi:peptide/nickel transport system ATP-binding protein
VADIALSLRAVAVDYVTRGAGWRRSKLRAVAGVDLDLRRGEFVGVVGESGSGKSSVAKAILGLVPIAAGELIVDGRDLAPLSRRRAREVRRRVQLVMQDPYEALDPHMTVGAIVEEALIVHKLHRDRETRRKAVLGALDSVGLLPADSFANRRPHELSGGQRQRVCIAAAVVVNPLVLIADEPVSMLDVSVRVDVLRLLDELRAEARAAVLMITHDLPTAAAFCDRILVMRAGQIVEQGPARSLVQHPRHPYTASLLDATPTLAPRGAAGVQATASGRGAMGEATR